ncbi:MAG TPA: glycosyltransferase family 39 protein [Pseudomonadales bacterium]|nr:glycosyltransferase family 39 protein [Pseudomonadales bacterium]
MMDNADTHTASAGHSIPARRARPVLAPFYSVSLVLVILLGSIERIYGIDRQSLWSDELFAVMASYANNIRDIWPLLINDSHPPGYVAFMYWTLPLSHYSDFEIRLHALFFGIYWIPIVFYIGKRWFSPEVGLLAAALTASAHPAIYYSQEARAYTMLVTFILANLACYLEILFRENPRKIFLYGFITTTILSLYFHYSGFVFFSAEILLYTLLIVSRQRKGSFREMFQLFVIPVLAYSPWFFVMVEQVLDGHNEWAVSAPPTGNDAYMLMQRLLGPDLEHFQFYCACLIVAALLIAERFRRHTAHQAHAVICSIFFLAAIPIFAFYLKSLVSTPIFEKRYFLHVSPFMAIIAAYSIDWVLQKLTNPFWKKPAFAITIVVFSAWTINTNITKGLYSELDKDPVREAAKLIKDDVVRNNLKDNYTTLMTYSWFEHYLARNNLVYDAAWQFHIFYIPQQIIEVQNYLKDRPAIDYFYYLEFEQKGAEYAAAALRREYKLLSSATVSSTLFDINVLKFSVREKPSAEEIKALGSNPVNDAAIQLSLKIAGKLPGTYATLVTHDWMEPYLQRNNVYLDQSWPQRKFYGDWKISEVTNYLNAHPAIETLYYMALRENNALVGADALAARYKLLDKFSTESSAGMMDTYSFDVRQSPTVADISNLPFSGVNPVNNAIAALKSVPGVENPEHYTFIFSHDWMEPYLVHNGMAYDKEWSGRHYYIDLQTENVLGHLGQHPAVDTLFYIALRSAETERAALLLKLQCKLVNQTAIETGAGPVDIYQFNTKSKPADIDALKAGLAGSPLDDIATWIARDSGKSDPKSSTVLFTHDWFKTYLREHDVHLDGELHGHFFSDEGQAPAIFSYTNTHPELDHLYYLALSQPGTQPAIDALKSRMHLTCEKSIDAPVGKLLLMRFNIKEAPTDTNAAVPVCKD